MMIRVLALAGLTLAAVAVPAMIVSDATETTTAANGQPLQAANTVGRLLAGDARFKTLVQAMASAGLGNLFKNGGPYTVFAPVDEAFAAEPKDKLDALMKPAGKKRLASLIQYHVVAGKIRSQDLPDGVTEVPTLEGGKLRIEKKTDGLWVNGAKVMQADMQASDGVVHAIDHVLAPPAQTD